eukprot:976194_1
MSTVHAKAVAAVVVMTIFFLLVALTYTYWGTGIFSTQCHRTIADTPLSADDLPSCKDEDEKKGDAIRAPLPGSPVPIQCGAAPLPGGAAPLPGTPSSSCSSLSPPPLPPPPIVSHNLDGRSPFVKMIHLHWDVLKDEDIKNTIWDDITDDNLKVSDDFQKAFESKTRVRKKKSGKNKPGIVFACLIDENRAFTGDIILKDLGMWSVKEMERKKTAILEMDDGELQVETLERLLEVIPSPEEAECVLAYKGTSKLNPTEEWFRIIGSVTDVCERLELLLFTKQFKEHAEDANTKLEAVGKSFVALKTSKALRGFLAIIR